MRPHQRAGLVAAIGGLLAFVSEPAVAAVGIPGLAAVGQLLGGLCLLLAGVVLWRLAIGTGEDISST